MKKIVLFTRLYNEDEFDAWRKMIESPTAGVTNTLDFNREDINLEVRNGYGILGSLHGYATDDIDNARVWLQKLKSQIENLTDPECVVGIHYGGDAPYREYVQPWVDRLAGEDNRDAVFIKQNFRTGGKPFINSYSISGGEPLAFVREKLQDLSTFYNQLKGESGSPPLEAKLELLHRCLTPDGAITILDGGFPKVLESERQKFWQDKVSGYENWTVEQIVKALAQRPDASKSIAFTDCFDSTYRTALEALRDALLPEHEFEIEKS